MFVQTVLKTTDYRCTLHSISCYFAINSSSAIIKFNTIYFSLGGMLPKYC